MSIVVCDSVSGNSAGKFAVFNSMKRARPICFGGFDSPAAFVDGVGCLVFAGAPVSMSEVTTVATAALESSSAIGSSLAHYLGPMAKHRNTAETMTNVSQRCQVTSSDFEIGKSILSLPRRSSAQSK